MEMLYDNEPVIAIIADPGILKGARHFQRKYHYIREVIQERKIVLKKVHTDDNVADPFIKPMSFDKHFEHAMAIRIVPASISGSIDDVARLFINKWICSPIIQTADPIKVRIGERQRAEGEPKLLDTTVGRVVPLLPVVSDASEPSHPHKKLKEDHGTSTRLSVAGKSRSALQRLLVGAVLNPKVGIVALPTPPFITSSESVTPEREDGDQTDFMARANLQTITTPPKFVISSDSSHHSCANIAKAEVDSFARPSAPLMTMTTTVTSTVDPTTTAKEKFVEPSIFGGGSSSGAKHTVGGFSVLTGSDFIVGGIRTVVSPDTDLQKVYVPQWSVTNGSCLDDGRTCREMVVASARGIIEMENLRCCCGRESDSVMKARDEVVCGLKSQLLIEEAKAARLSVSVAEVQALANVADLDGVVTSVKVHNDNLSDQAHTLEVSSAGLQGKVTAYENFIGQLEKFQDDRMREINENFDKMDTDLVELALHSEERFYPHLLTTISGRRWLLTHGLELVIAKCLNSTKYLSSLGAGIGKAVEKGMQEGLSSGITHGAAGRVLTDVAVYNPSAEADYLSALQRLQSVNFSLITELKSNKEASIDTIMNLLRLEDSLAERLGLTESQPRVDQLMVPIHHSPDQRVIGASALSLSSALRDVFVPLSEPLSATALTGTEVISATIDTPTTLSTTLAFVSTITPISIEDYEVAGTDGQEAVNESVPNDATGGNVNPFPNVDDVELNVSQ
ncbi:hypothetical protein Tco_0665655 [Tanacetum coccineum]